MVQAMSYGGRSVCVPYPGCRPYLHQGAPGDASHCPRPHLPPPGGFPSMSFLTMEALAADTNMSTDAAPPYPWSGTIAELGKYPLKFPKLTYFWNKRLLLASPGDGAVDLDPS
ncbi:hypothetical protein LAZ67_13002519 [Cordylochernes scorpioides]|uniref:Uncharacterized protein n=1 Tax=Cordylochernes scorpioides TaxID=51811 RepID=A0ABY6L8L7_9ARAC|nr:hypothetical protein LAZ67_13002519 [Cordylochernes scorpioides]